MSLHQRNKFLCIPPILNDQIIKYLEDAYTSILTGTAPSAAMTTYAAGVNQVLSNYKLITASQSQ